MNIKIVGKSFENCTYHLITENGDLLDSHFSSNENWARSDLLNKNDLELYKKLFGDIEIEEFKLVGNTDRYDLLLQKQVIEKGCQQDYSEYVNKLLQSPDNSRKVGVDD